MYMAGDTPMGVEPDLAKYIGDALGAEVQYQVCKKAEALAAVTAGEADVAVGCINRSGSLSTEYLMSDSYGKGYFYAVTKAGDYALTIGALKNSAVGVDQGLDEDTRSKLYQAEEIRLTDYGSAKEGGDDVKEGVIRAYICYEDQARILLEDEALQVQNKRDQYADTAVSGKGIGRWHILTVQKTGPCGRSALGSCKRSARPKTR